MVRVGVRVMVRVKMKVKATVTMTVTVLNPRRMLTTQGGRGGLG